MTRVELIKSIQEYFVDQEHLLVEDIVPFINDNQNTLDFKALEIYFDNNYQFEIRSETLVKFQIITFIVGTDFFCPVKRYTHEATADIILNIIDKTKYLQQCLSNPSTK